MTDRVNVNTVARAAQVSRQTVTNVLRHPERVAPDTLSRVEAEIARLGYRPSAAAQSLQANARVRSAWSSTPSVPTTTTR